MIMITLGCLSFYLTEVNVFYLLLITGPTMSEQARPTEEMNGELNHEELPPQVIKRCGEDFQIILSLYCARDFK